MRARQMAGIGRSGHLLRTFSLPLFSACRFGHFGRSRIPHLRYEARRLEGRALSGPKSVDTFGEGKCVPLKAKMYGAADFWVGHLIGSCGATSAGFGEAVSSGKGC